MVAGVTLAPFSLALKGDAERAQIIQAFQAALNGLTIPWELVSFYRPVDLDVHLTALDHRQATVTGTRRQVLRDYTRWVQQQIQGGELVERRYYLVLTRSAPTRWPTTARRSAASSMTWAAFGAFGPRPIPSTRRRTWASNGRRRIRQ